MSRYRVKVESYVVVEGRNVAEAKAHAELAVRKAIKAAYVGDERFADGWDRFGFLATGKPERLTDDD
jgi:hypothetical protein